VTHGVQTVEVVKKLLHQQGQVKQLQLLQQHQQQLDQDQDQDLNLHHAIVLVFHGKFIFIY
jgi:hypothetical protein